MNRRQLGFSGPTVSRLCFGTLTVGPAQQNLDPALAADLFCRAYELGVNFFDTAELYETYHPLSLALKKRPDLVIASRSYAVTFSDMKRSLDLARRQLNRDYIDIFGIHELESAASLKGHQGALECLYQARADGIIKAVEISTHTVAGVRAGATEPGIDVIHPLLNKAGIGIKDGTVADMVEAIRMAKEFGKGIYAMKALAGGHLISEATAALRFVMDLDCVDAVAVGIQSLNELKLNCLVFNGEPVPGDLFSAVGNTGRRLEIEPWCQGCGRCVERCGFQALMMENGRPRVIAEKCVRCGYCARVCPEFCLKVV